MTDDDTRQILIKSWHGIADDRRVRARAKVPALTVLYHPDPGRVGERAVLHELATGLSAGVSRSEPDFAPPDDSRRAPLDDLYLSRKPIRFVHEARDDRIRLVAGDSPTRLTADGTAVDDERVFALDDVERGVVLELGRRVVLLLHTLTPRTPDTATDHFGLVGASDAMVRLLQDIRIVADLDIPVLLRGETGTGKELAAHSIHAAGRLRDQAFLSVNMGAITPTLAASELFGAVKGAFTGAVRSHAGYFQRAHGGTLFLDEIGETPPEIQVMLLRVLESGEVQRVGAQEPQRVKVRLIAATDADLEGEIEAGRFREPLLHRLAGYEISIPPLRRRRDDFGRLLFHFLREELRALGEEHRLEPAAPEARPWMPTSIVARLALYDWPGNVRQLRNVARQLVVGSRDADVVRVPEPVERLLRDAVASASTVTLAPTDDEEEPAPAEPEAKPEPRPRFRKPSEVTEDELHAALEANQWELKPTAAALRISRGSLYNLIERSQRLRKASDLSRAEILECHEACGGDLGRMVERLEISRSGLQMRMRALGIE